MDSRVTRGDIPVGTVVKNLPASAGDIGSISAPLAVEYNIRMTYICIKISDIC